MHSDVSSDKSLEIIASRRFYEFVIGQISSTTFVTQRPAMTLSFATHCTRLETKSQWFISAIAGYF